MYNITTEAVVTKLIEGMIPELVEGDMESEDANILINMASFYIAIDYTQNVSQEDNEIDGFTESTETVKKNLTAYDSVLYINSTGDELSLTINQEQLILNTWTN